MDIRRWPWKKKTSNKTVSTTDASGSVPDKGSSKGDQGKNKNVKVPAETYAHLIEMKAQVKVLKENLLSAQSEMTAKDNLVKQHARVAEEAIAGWEKAEAESTTMKTQLESVKLQKLTAEDRAAHLDEELKWCIEEIRNVKEEKAQMLHDTIFSQTKQWEAIKSELDARIVDFERELQQNSAENSALSRSLQDRSNMLIRVSNEKSQAEAEIEFLKSGIQSCEKELNSLKYEIHVVTKELEIRNEEKNMSVRLAETANKQHIEDVKKISKLEAECQRLRGLVKKKLPGPATLAQMKLEVETFGRISPAKSSSSFVSSLPSSEDIHQCHKENEMLTARLLATEEETKTLKEALTKQNNELQATRTICSKMSSKLRGIEAQALVMSQKDPMISYTAFSIEGLNRHQSNLSLTSMSEDGIDVEGSCSESCSVAMLSDLPQLKENSKEKNSNSKSKNMELMDDFLEMEKLAFLSTESDENITNSLAPVEKVVGKKTNILHGDKEQSIGNITTNTNTILVSKLKSGINPLFEAGTLEIDVEKLLEDIRQTVQDIHNELPQHASNFTTEEAHCGNGTSEQKLCTNKHTISLELKNAISQINDIVVPLCKEAMEMQGRYSDDQLVINEKITKFSTSIDRLLVEEISLDDFIFALLNILSEMRDVRLNLFSNKRSDTEGHNNDCIDKVTLLEKRIAKHKSATPKISGECESPSSSSSDAANSHMVKCPDFELQGYEQMKVAKDHMEQQLADLKSQLATCQKSNSLAETKLKCMAESYNSLESRAQELKTEINFLRSKAEALDKELQEERRRHQDDLEKSKKLQEQFERESKLNADEEVDKAKQDREIAAATKKLAECQENILLLGSQLKSMQPPIDTSSSSSTNKHQTSNSHGEPTPNAYSLQYIFNSAQTDQSSTDNNDASSVIMTTGGDSEAYLSESYFESLPPRADGSSKCKKNRSRPASSSSLSSVLNEKQSRGLGRFFSRGK